MPAEDEGAPMRTVQITRPHPARGVIAAGLALAGLALTACSAGADSAPAETTPPAPSSPAVTSASTPAPSSSAGQEVGSATPTVGEASDLTLEEPAPAAFPASLFQEDGTTLQEWAADHPEYRDLEGVTRIEERVAEKELRLTLADVPQGTRHRVVLICDDGVAGGSSLSLGTGGAVDRGVWSEDCGWIATLPPVPEQRDVTFLVRADGDGPFRFVVGEVQEDGQG